jgi:hypothetical protein
LRKNDDSPLAGLLRKRGALSTSAARFRPDQIFCFGLFAPIDSVFDFVL